MTEVRFAVPSDIPALIAMGRQMHVQSRYAWMAFSSDRLWKFLERIIPSKQHCVIVAADSDTTLGMPLSGVLMASTHLYPFSSDAMAQMDYLYVAPARRGSPIAMKMLAGFRRWANNREVAEIVIANQFGVNQVATGKLLNRLGIPAVGGLHSMWVERK